jgi:hypothetical protein
VLSGDDDASKIGASTANPKVSDGDDAEIGTGSSTGGDTQPLKKKKR